MIITLFVGACLCLLLETAGTPKGFRKLGPRPHIFLVAFATTVASMTSLYFSETLMPDKYALWIVGFGTLSSLVLAAPQMRHINRERGDAYALILVGYALIAWMITRHHLLDFIVAATLWVLTSISLISFRGSRQITSGVAAKFILLLLFWFSWMSIGLITSDNRILVLGVLIFMGISPLNGLHASYVEGAPPFVGMTFALGSFIAGSMMLTQILSAPYPDVIWILSAAALIVPGILALDAQRIGRVCIHLLFINASLCLTTLLLLPESLLLTLVNTCIVTIGLLTGLMFWKHTTKADKTWEDFAGAGRKHPIIGAAWLVVMSSVVGIPGTLGFSIRLQLVQAATEQNREWFAGVIILSSIIAAVPLIRLAVFLFAKPTHFDIARHHQPRQYAIVIACGLATMLGNLLF